jgi:hypothetical protein
MLLIHFILVSFIYDWEWGHLLCLTKCSSPDIYVAGEPLYRLLEARVCRFLAEVLLRQAGKFNLKDFLSSWQQSVPEG